MVRIKISWLVILFAFIFSSCLKEEQPIKPYDRGDIEQGTVSFGDNYSLQSYFNLGTKEVLSTNYKTAWDLAFESSPNGVRIIINSAKKMYAANTKSTDFNLTDTNGLGLRFNWDNANLKEDSLALYGWLANDNQTLQNQVWIIDRGTDQNFTSLGLKKIQLVAYDGASFTMRYGNLNNTDTNTIKIFKNEHLNFTYFTFEEGGKVAIIEPDKESWDFLFTQYVHTFYSPSFEEYLVAGVLINPHHIEIANLFDQSFEQIDYHDIKDYDFSNAPNSIGYDWKFYDFDAGGYVMVPDRNYIIKNNQDGFYYKLRFIDFYNESGEKGNPVFEFQKI